MCPVESRAFAPLLIARYGHRKYIRLVMRSFGGDIERQPLQNNTTPATAICSTKWKLLRHPSTNHMVSVPRAYHSGGLVHAGLVPCLCFAHPPRQSSHPVPGLP